MKSETLSAFIVFIEKNNIKDAAIIKGFASLPQAMWEHGLAFAKEYKIELKTEDFFMLEKVPADLWPTFLAIIKEHNIKDRSTIVELALVGLIYGLPTHIAHKSIVTRWTELADFIKTGDVHSLRVFQAITMKSDSPREKNILQLFRIIPPKSRLPELRAFVQQWNITDLSIIKAILHIPRHALWEPLLNMAAPLLQPPLIEDDYHYILETLYRALELEQFDDIDLRLRVDDAVQARINRMMPTDSQDYLARLEEILRTPQNQLLAMRAAAQAGATNLSVHAIGRDQATSDAMKIFIDLPYNEKYTDSDYKAFVNYLEGFPNESIKNNAKKVIGLESATGFAPIRMDVTITAHGLELTGKQFFARLWHFINEGSFIGNDDTQALLKERSNAKVSLISNLSKGYEDDHVVCDPGKIQRIAVGVLQGRLAGVHVDQEVPINPSLAINEQALTAEMQEKFIKDSVATSLKAFLNGPEQQAAQTQIELRRQADKWLQNGPTYGIAENMIEEYKYKFIEDLKVFLRLSDLPKAKIYKEVILDASNGNEKTPLELFEGAVQILIEGLNVDFPQGNEVGYVKDQLTNIGIKFFNSTTNQINTTADNKDKLVKAVKDLFEDPRVQPLAKHKHWREIFRDFAILVGYIATAGIAAYVVHKKQRVFSLRHRLV